MTAQATQSIARRNRRTADTIDLERESCYSVSDDSPALNKPVRVAYMTTP